MNLWLHHCMCNTYLFGCSLSNRVSYLCGRFRQCVTIEQVDYVFIGLSFVAKVELHIAYDGVLKYTWEEADVPSSVFEISKILSDIWSGRPGKGVGPEENLSERTSKCRNWRKKL